MCMFCWEKVPAPNVSDLEYCSKFSVSVWSSSCHEQDFKEHFKTWTPCMLFPINLHSKAKALLTLGTAEGLRAWSLRCKFRVLRFRQGC